MRIRVLAFTMCVGAPATLVAQTHMVIKGSPTCAECRLKTVVAASIGAPSDQVALTMRSFATVSGRGWYYVASATEPGTIAVYDSAGKFRRLVGRSGSGPGELRAINVLAFGNDDTLHVIGERESVFTRDGLFVRSRNIPGAFQVRAASVLANGALLLQGSVASADRIGLPFHVLSAGVDTLSSFGTLAAEPFIHNVFDGSRWLAMSGASSFWASRLNAYKIELWSTNGTLRRTIEREVDWFTPWKWSPQKSFDVRTARPDPWVAGISVDRDQRLWILIQVPDEQWKPMSASEAAAAKRLGPSEYSQIVDTMVEVIDLRTGRLILSERLPGALNGFVGPAVASELVEDSMGFISLRALRLSIGQ